MIFRRSRKAFINKMIMLSIWLLGTLLTNYLDNPNIWLFTTAIIVISIIEICVIVDYKWNHITQIEGNEITIIQLWRRKTYHLADVQSYRILRQSIVANMTTGQVDVNTYGLTESDSEELRNIFRNLSAKCLEEMTE